jgi:PiT family inorganic phosphate transporter
VLVVIFASLVGAIVWNLLTWWWGLPSSSSHALAGGMIGATLPALGHAGLVDSGIAKIAAFIVLSPLIGMVLGSFNMVVTTWIVRRQAPARVDAWFRRLQLLSAAVFSYSHGTNDAQKVMGIIAHPLRHHLKNRPSTCHDGNACHTAIRLGTFFGGWRIVKTMGQRLTKLQPIGGFCAETGGGVTILALAAAGIPVSTTHTITGAIVGVGATRGPAVAGAWRPDDWAWIPTIPAAALLAAMFVLTRALVRRAGKSCPTESPTASATGAGAPEIGLARTTT